MLNFFDLVTTFFHNYELINIFVDIGLRILSKQTQLSISVHHKYVNHEFGRQFVNFVC